MVFRCGWVMILASFILSGCGSLFHVSTEQVNKFQADFVGIVDHAAKEEVNGQKVLDEVRQKYESKEIKKTKVQNILTNGIDITKNMKDDVVAATVPENMQSLRDKFIAALDKRIQAYNTLFQYYDFLHEQDKVDGDRMLKDSLAMFDEVKKETDKFRK